MVVQIVKSVRNKKFKMIKPNINQNTLYEMGFKILSHEDNTFYIRIPVLRYKKIPTLFGNIITDLDGNITLECETPSGNIYQPFYHYDYGDYDPILKEINNNFTKELRKLYIHEKKRKSKKNISIYAG